MKYLVENWIMRSEGSKGGTRRIKEEKDLRGRAEPRGRGTIGYKEPTGASTLGNAAASSCSLYVHVTVYVKETKPLAENASQRQPVCGNRDEMTLVLALIGPSR